MNGKKEFSNEFITTIKRYNDELVDSFIEARVLSPPPIDLISDLMSALKNNYDKFEQFHCRESLLKNSAIATLKSELSSTKAKLEKALFHPEEDLSSYE